MLEILRSLTRTAEEKRQEELNAYLDGELHGRAREQFEARLGTEPELRAELAQLRAVKDGLGQLPRLRAPRNYTLDPAVYGRQAPARTPTLYPALRLATVLTAFLLVLALGLEIVPGTPAATETAGDSVALMENTAEEVAMEAAGETSAMEAPEEPMMQEAEQEAERSAADEAAPAEADIAGAAAITATNTVTEEAALMASPVEEEAEEAVEEAEAPAGEEAAPLAPEATQVAGEVVEVPTAPPPVTPSPEPAQEAAREGAGMEPLRIVQAALGVAFVILLTATLLLRRRAI